MTQADSQFIWLDGEIKPFHDANVHVLSHSLHYGSAAFEGIRAYETADGRTAIFRAQEHMLRFARSAGVFGGELAFDSAQLTTAMREVVKANKFNECYLRPLAYIGSASRGLRLPTNPKMHVAIAAWRWGKYLGENAAEKGIKVHVASFRRPDVASSLPWAKLSGNYLNSIMARREASLYGMDEALLLDQQGFVAEGSGENIFALIGGALVTPPAHAILPGITRDCVFSLARDIGLEVRETALTRNQLYEADELFFTGTAAEITPISSVDGRSIGTGKPGPVAGKISALYEQATRGELSKYKEWLTYV